MIKYVFLFTSYDWIHIQRALHHAPSSSHHLRQDSKDGILIALLNRYNVEAGVRVNVLGLQGIDSQSSILLSRADKEASSWECQLTLLGLSCDRGKDNALVVAGAELGRGDGESLDGATPLALQCLDLKSGDAQSLCEIRPCNGDEVGFGARAGEVGSGRCSRSKPDRGLDNGTIGVVNHGKEAVLHSGRVGNHDGILGVDELLDAALDCLSDLVCIFGSSLNDGTSHGETSSCSSLELLFSDANASHFDEERDGLSKTHGVSSNLGVSTSLREAIHSS